MKYYALLFMIGMTLLVGCDDHAINISEVKVWGKDFNVIQTINQPEVINEIKTIWIAKKKVEPQKRPDFIYMIDILSEGRSTRWLYDPYGYATVLSKAKVPIYKIEEANKFNKIIIP